MTYKLPLRVLLILACVACLVQGARAQFRAGIQGTILDPQAAGIEGATVTLTNQETNRVLVRTTDSNGVYNFLGLPPGQYSVSAEKAGFKKKVLANINLAAEQTQSLNIALEIGAVSDSVIVNGDA